MTGSCDLCANAAAVVIVTDQELRERQLCADCWRHASAAIPGLKVLAFAGPQGRRPK